MAMSCTVALVATASAAALCCALMAVSNASLVEATADAPRYVFWQAGNGIWRKPLGATSASKAQCIYNITTSGPDVDQLAVDDLYVYWGELWCMNRCAHDGSALERCWLDLNQTKYGHGLVDNMLLYNRSLYYQTQADYNLYAVELDGPHLPVQNLGHFGYAGNGGMNGALAASSRRDGSELTLYWGLDESEAGTDGEVVAWHPGSSDDPKVLSTALPFPRAIGAFPELGGLLAGGYNSGAVLLALAGATPGYAGPPGAQGLEPCSLEIVPDIEAVFVGYVGQPGTKYGIYMLNYSTGVWTAFDTDSAWSPCYVHVAPPASAGGPTLKSISPTSGKQAGGGTLFALGDGFTHSSGLACRFGGAVTTAATFHTAQVVECAVPPSPIAGKALVQLTNDGRVYTAQQVFYTYE